jgi:hypothetical protein
MPLVPRLGEDSERGTGSEFFPNPRPDFWERVERLAGPGEGHPSKQKAPAQKGRGLGEKALVGQSVVELAAKRVICSGLRTRDSGCGRRRGGVSGDATDRAVWQLAD